jgi:endonuclease III
MGRLVDELAADLHDLTVLLAAIHATPHLGNKEDPVDELIYIILSRRTREGAYQAAFERLKQSFPCWEAILDTPVAEIEQVLFSSGLARRKARSIREALQTLLDRFGRCTLEPTTTWTDAEVASFLCSLPEVGPKSAACVMMCSLDRPAFPVDSHVGRVLARVGVFSRVGLELAGRDHKEKQSALWDLVPPSIRYPLHVNALMHGRKFCAAARPRCAQCPLQHICEFGRARTAN